LEDTTRKARSGGVPEPKPDIPADELEASVTIFMTAGERNAVLARLRRVHRARREALLRVLKITPSECSRTAREEPGDGR